MPGCFSFFQTMCGIAGIFQLQAQPADYRNQLAIAVDRLQKRGPDSRGFFHSPGVWLGHSRLGILDPSEAANQPFRDPSGRYCLVYNGEIYNFGQLRHQLQNKGVAFNSGSDTEVLLHWLIEKGAGGLQQLQGFFAFAFYDQKTHQLILARDRLGIKPLYWHLEGNTLMFASEMKAMAALGIPRKIDQASLELYLQLNYIPAPWTIFRGIHKMLPGQYLQISANETELRQYYKIQAGGDSPAAEAIPSYEKACGMLAGKLEQSVVKRLVADVPLGAFLSGGIDSSIITALAARHVKGLNTYSIGFSDEPMFDETRYARLVSKMHGTHHTEFHLRTDDLLQCLPEVMDYTDEPFADSSALAVYILSRETRKKVSVALSGDGADEMFAGYNKHMAEYRARSKSLGAVFLGKMHPLLRQLPQSRHNPLSNKIRQLERFAASVNLPAESRYWNWACIASGKEAANLMGSHSLSEQAMTRQNRLLEPLAGNSHFENVLLTDMQLVLPNDMLTKVDMMSMANSLEVRVPFLDHELVDWVFTLPSHYRIDKRRRKKILKDAFSRELPPEVLQRGKQGFEVPLLKWFRGELKSMITHDMLQDELIREQKIFNPLAVSLLKKKLFSSNPGDSAARVWGLLVFQHWFRKNTMD